MTGRRPAAARIAAALAGISPWRLAATLLIALAGALVFRMLDLPLPWMLGPLAFGLVACLAGMKPEMPSPVRGPAITVVGVLLGARFSDIEAGDVLHWYPSLIGMLVYCAAGGALCMWYLRRVHGLDPMTAYHAGMPGGLVEMAAQAEERGADVGTVALVHSFRVVIIVFLLPFIASAATGEWLGAATPVPRPTTTGALASLGWLVLCAGVGALLGRLMRLPAPFLLGPVMVSGVVHAAGISDFQPHPTLVSAAQLIVGTVLATRFAGIAPSTVLRGVVQSVGVVALLMALSTIFALAFTVLTGKDFVSLLLALSAGGLTESSLVALAVQADVAFVATHHLLRIVVVAFGAPLVLAVLDRRGRPPPAGPA